MRVKRKPMPPTTLGTRPAPGPVFNNSLLAWHARIKSQRETQPTGLPPKTSQVGTQV